MFWKAAEPKYMSFNHLSANPTKWSNTLEQFVYNLSKNYLSVFDHFMGLVLKGLSAATNLVIFTDVFKGYIRQIIQKWAKWNLWKTIYEKFPFLNTLPHIKRPVAWNGLKDLSTDEEQLTRFLRFGTNLCNLINVKNTHEKVLLSALY